MFNLVTCYSIHSKFVILYNVVCFVSKNLLHIAGILELVSTLVPTLQKGCINRFCDSIAGLRASHSRRL